MIWFSFKRKFIMIFGLLALCIMLASPVSAAYGFAYSSFAMPASYAADTAQNQYLQHSSGKLIYAYFDATANRLVVKQYSSAGALEATQPIAPNPLYTPYSVNEKIKLVSINATTLAIGFCYDYSTTRLYFNVIIWNVNTMSQVGASYTGYASYAGTYYAIKVSPLTAVTYSGNIYWLMFTNSEYAANSQDYVYAVYDLTGSSVSVVRTSFGTASSGTVLPAPLYVYQRPTALDQVFIFSSRTSDVTLGKMYLVDLDSPATLTLITTSPGVGYITNDYRMFYLGGGEFANGDNKYLYFNLACPYLSGTARRYMVTQTRLLFNQTYTVGNLLEQDVLQTDMNPVVAGGSVVSYIVGFTADKENFKVIFPQTAGGVTTSYYCEYVITDWTNFAGAVMTPGTWTMDPNNPVLSDLDVAAYDAKWSSQARLTANSVYVYYSLSPESATWDIALIWVPNDAPLKTSTPYTFTMTSTLNGYAATMNVFTYVDGIHVSTHATDANGKYVFAWTFYTIGLRNVTFSLYDYQAGFQYKESFMFVAAPSAVPDPDAAEVLVPSWTNSFAVWLPMVLVIFIPTIAFTGLLGQCHAPMEGMIMGLVVGISAAYLGGIITPAIFYLFVLALAVLLVTKVKGMAGV